MSALNFRTLDLNLLRVFDEVMAERSLTRAAHKLAITQPAVSNALRRLREALGDELLVRQGQGVEHPGQAQGNAGAGLADASGAGGWHGIGHGCGKRQHPAQGRCVGGNQGDGEHRSMIAVAFPAPLVQAQNPGVMRWFGPHFQGSMAAAMRLRPWDLAW